eukprot:COSAG04_NODE_848_length_9881_cov_5.280822_14_plen_196_part_00
MWPHKWWEVVVRGREVCLVWLPPSPVASASRAPPSRTNRAPSASRCLLSTSPAAAPPAPHSTAPAARTTSAKLCTECSGQATRPGQEHCQHQGVEAWLSRGRAAVMHSECGSAGEETLHGDTGHSKDKPGEETDLRVQQPLYDGLHLLRNVMLPLELAVAGVRSDLLVGGEVVLRGEGGRAAGGGGRGGGLAAGD